MEPWDSYLRVLLLLCICLLYTCVVYFNFVFLNYIISWNCMQWLLFNFKMCWMILLCDIRLFNIIIRSLSGLLYTLQVCHQHIWIITIRYIFSMLCKMLCSVLDTYISNSIIAEWENPLIFLQFDNICFKWWIVLFTDTGIIDRIFHHLFFFSLNIPVYY